MFCILSVDIYWALDGDGVGFSTGVTAKDTNKEADVGAFSTIALGFQARVLLSQIRFFIGYRVEDLLFLEGDFYIQNMAILFSNMR